MGLLQISPLSLWFVLIPLTLSSQSSFFISMIPSLSVISFMDPTFAVASRKSSLPHTKSSGFSPMLSSRSFMVLCFIFKCMIHFELIFVNCVRIVSKFFFCMWMSSCFSTICWKDYLCPIELLFLCCQRSVDCIYVGQFLGSLFCSIDMSILLPVLHCLDCFGFIMRFEVW